MTFKKIDTLYQYLLGDFNFDETSYIAKKDQTIYQHKNPAIGM